MIFESLLWVVKLFGNELKLKSDTSATEKLKFQLCGLRVISDNKWHTTEKNIKIGTFGYHLKINSRKFEVPGIW